MQNYFIIIIIIIIIITTTTRKRTNRGRWKNILMHNEYLRNTAGRTTKSINTEMGTVICNN